MFNSAFLFWKAWMHLLKFSQVSLSKLLPAIFSKFFSEIYLSPIINYWDSIFTWPNVRSVQFGLCFTRIFFFLSSFFFLFLLVFSLSDTNDSQDCRDGRGNHCFSFFHFYPLTKIHLVPRDFNHFFLISLFVITRLIANKTSSP